MRRTRSAHRFTSGVGGAGEHIDPDPCINCDLCRPECPVEAIFADHDLPDEQKEWIAINAEKSQQCPPITEKKPPLRQP